MRLASERIWRQNRFYFAHQSLPYAPFRANSPSSRYFGLSSRSIKCAFPKQSPSMKARKIRPDPPRTSWQGANVRYKKRSRRPQRASIQLAVTGGLAGILLGLGWLHSDRLGFSGAAEPRHSEIGCTAPIVIDGDTLRCPSGRIRLAGIDAPEMPGHCRPGRECTPGDPYASSTHLRLLISGSAVQCRKVDTDRYGRIVARCTANAIDLSCAQIDAGHAVRRYGGLDC